MLMKTKIRKKNKEEEVEDESEHGNKQKEEEENDDNDNKETEKNWTEALTLLKQRNTEMKDMSTILVTTYFGLLNFKKTTK